MTINPDFKPQIFLLSLLFSLSACGQDAEPDSADASDYGYKCVSSLCPKDEDDVIQEPPPLDKNSVLVPTGYVNYQPDRTEQYRLYDMRSGKPRLVTGEVWTWWLDDNSEQMPVQLPKVWTPDLKFRVKWTESDKKNTYEMGSVDLTVPKYQEPGTLYVVFNPDKTVELVVSKVEPGAKGWQTTKTNLGSYDYCMANHQKKYCEQNLMIYQFESPEYWAWDMRQYCAEEKIKYLKDGEKELKEIFDKDPNGTYMGTPIKDAYPSIQKTLAGRISYCAKEKEECLQSGIDKAMCELDYDKFEEEK